MPHWQLTNNQSNVEIDYTKSGPWQENHVGRISLRRLMETRGALSWDHESPFRQIIIG